MLYLECKCLNNLPADDYFHPSDCLSVTGVGELLTPKPSCLLSWQNKFEDGGSSSLWLSCNIH